MNSYRAAYALSWLLIGIGASAIGALIAGIIALIGGIVGLR